MHCPAAPVGVITACRTLLFPVAGDNRGVYVQPYLFQGADLATSKVQVALTQGTLDSKTALEVLNWANVALLGDEIIQWRNANVLASGLYELSGLLRGRRGTESAMASHATGERFILLTNDGVYRAPLPMTEISRTAYYKGIPDGGNWDDAPSNPFVFKGNSLRCLSPVQVAGTRDGSGNLTINWKRRTRWYGEWQDGTDVPMFEASENYEKNEH